MLQTKMFIEMFDDMQPHLFCEVCGERSPDDVYYVEYVMIEGKLVPQVMCTSCRAAHKEAERWESWKEDRCNS